MVEIFKCKVCGDIHDHDAMASEVDISVCKWCNGEIDDD